MTEPLGSSVLGRRARLSEPRLAAVRRREIGRTGGRERGRVNSRPSSSIDGSPDDSLEVLRRIACPNGSLHAQVICLSRNFGSVFEPIRAGMAVARGDFVGCHGCRSPGAGRRSWPAFFDVLEAGVRATSYLASAPRGRDDPARLRPGARGAIWWLYQTVRQPRRAGWRRRCLRLHARGLPDEVVAFTETHIELGRTAVLGGIPAKLYPVRTGRPALRPERMDVADGRFATYSTASMPSRTCQCVLLQVVGAIGFVAVRHRRRGRLRRMADRERSSEPGYTPV